VIATYVSFLLILGSAALIGQAIFALCGRRTWSRLSPAVGLAALTALAWGTVRLPGDATAALVAMGAAGLVSAAYLTGRLDDGPRALRVGIPLEIAAVLLASLPFIVEGRFGILGTGLNPDMSQHLLEAGRLGAGEGGRLLGAGYPLGPHALVAALSKVGISTVHGFDGLTLATAVAMCLAPLALLWRLPASRRIAGALLVGLSYMTASYLVQGAFKELLEALFVLAFAIGLHQLSSGELNPRGRRQALPLAVLGVGAVYCYSFPGLFWLAGAAVIWAGLEVLSGTGLRDRLPALGVALVVLGVAIAPEIGRMVDFGSFNTFDPRGPGLGNLFNRVSPLEALGIWPSGDFRVEPGDGFAPAIAFLAGSAFALAALAWGLRDWVRRAEWAVPAALAAAAALILYTFASGTPYQEAKAIAIASPLVMLVIVRPALESSRGGPVGAFASTFLAAAAASSLLGLVNGPVGPSSYSPALTGLRGALGSGSTVFLASPELLKEEHGGDFVIWELRGGRVCVEAAGAPSDRLPPAGAAHVVSQGGESTAPFAGLRFERRAGPYVLWARTPPPGGDGSCPLIAPASARANPG
jgi:hypothetical protein